MGLSRRGNSYIEITTVCVLLAVICLMFVPGEEDGIARARDARLRTTFEALRLAMAGYLLAHGGRAPEAAADLVPYLVLQAGSDPLVWHGSAGHGRIKVVAGSLVLQDDAGRPPSGKDKFGRPYADYR